MLAKCHPTTRIPGIVMELFICTVLVQIITIINKVCGLAVEKLHPTTSQNNKSNIPFQRCWVQEVQKDTRELAQTYCLQRHAACLSCCLGCWNKTETHAPSLILLHSLVTRYCNKHLPAKIPQNWISVRCSMLTVACTQVNQP